MVGRPRKKGTIDGIQYGEPDINGVYRTFIAPDDYVRCSECGKSWNRTFQRKNKLKCPNCGNNRKDLMRTLTEESVK